MLANKTTWASWTLHSGIACLLYCVVLAYLFSPIASQLGSRLLSEGGDAYLYLWGNWWFGRAMSNDISSVYSCAMVLHPFGADLTQHDFPLGANFLAWLFGKAGLGLVGAYNACFLTALLMNALSAFLLVYQVLRDDGETAKLFDWGFVSALAGGIVFAFSPFIWSRCRGHSTLLHAYALPLLALCLERARTSGSRAWYACSGCALVLAALSNYYYFVYGVLYVLGFCAYHTIQVRVSLGSRDRVHRPLVITLFLCGLLALLIALGIFMTGGGLLRIAGAKISLIGTSNPLIAWWLLWLAALMLKYRLGVELRRRHDARQPPVISRIGWTAVPLIVLTPLFVRAASLLISGDFAAQSLGWKSGPAGAFPLAFLLPNMYHSAWGESLRDLFGSWDTMESMSVGLGLTPILLVVFTGSWRIPGWWRFAFVAAAILSLGPFLRFWPGFEHGPLLPFWFVRYIPIMSGARIPSRWIVVALIAWAVLVARSFAMQKRPLVRIGCLLFVAVELISFPVWTVPTAVPRVYRALAEKPANGALLELPFGVMDGRHAEGMSFPPELLFYQTVHGRPIVGGYLSRVPDRIFEAYGTDPTLRALIDLQEGRREGISDDDLAKISARWDIRWIVLDERRASRQLASAIRSACGVPDFTDDGRSLFTLAGSDASPH